MQSICIFGIIFSKEEIMQSKKEVGLNFIKKFYTDFICPYCKEKMYFAGESLKCTNKIGRASCRERV